MDLGDPVKTVVYYLLIGGMAYLGHHDGFPMMSALMCMVTCWIRPTMNHDVRLLIITIYQATIPYGFSTLREY